jgi:uncharacterized membrane protein (UPF0136 family)
MVSAVALTNHLAAQLVFFLVGGGVYGFVKAGSRASLIAGGICGGIEILLASAARAQPLVVPYLAFFNLFLAISFARKLLAAKPVAKPAPLLVHPAPGARVALAPIKRCPITGQAGSGCPGTPSTSAGSTPKAGPGANAYAEEDPEMIVLEDKPPARAGPDVMRLTQVILVCWSLATAVVAFTTWHSRAKVPLLSATFALTALSMLRE